MTAETVSLATQLSKPTESHRSAAFRLQKRAIDRAADEAERGVTWRTFLQRKRRAPVSKDECKGNRSAAFRLQKRAINGAADEAERGVA